MVENVLHLGLCLPKSCSNNQVHNLVQAFFNSSESQNEVKPKVLEVKHPKFDPRFFFKKTVVALGACVIVAALLKRGAINLEKDIKNDENNNIALGTENESKLSFQQKIIQCFNYEQNKRSICSRELSISGANSISGMR